MEALKNAILIPLIKDLEGHMDKDELKNYRPVSNLLFVGKLIEQVFSMQLNQHMSKNNLSFKVSAYDTVDQSKVLSILHDDIVIEGTALRWFSSFFKGRTLKGKMDAAYSIELKYGVAQGVVLYIQSF